MQSALAEIGVGSSADVPAEAVFEGAHANTGSFGGPGPATLLRILDRLEQAHANSFTGD
jgi:hypothetical protein